MTGASVWRCRKGGLCTTGGAQRRPSPPQTHPLTPGRRSAPPRLFRRSWRRGQRRPAPPRDGNPPLPPPKTAATTSPISAHHKCLATSNTASATVAATAAQATPLGATGALRGGRAGGWRRKPPRFGSVRGACVHAPALCTDCRPRGWSIRHSTPRAALCLARAWVDKAGAACARASPPVFPSHPTYAWLFRPRLCCPLCNPRNSPSSLLHGTPPRLRSFPLLHPLLPSFNSLPSPSLRHFPTVLPVFTQWLFSAPTAAVPTSRRSARLPTAAKCSATSIALGPTASGWRRSLLLRRRLRQPQRRLRHGKRRCRPRRGGSQLTPTRIVGG